MRSSYVLLEGKILSDNCKTEDVLWNAMSGVDEPTWENKSVAHMRMLCWIYGKTRRNMIKNDSIRETHKKRDFCEKKMHYF